MSSKPENYKTEPHPSYDGTRKEWLQLNYDTQHYHYNKEKRNSEKRERRQELVQWVSGIKAEEGCHFCDEDEPVALDFHHLQSDEKDNSVASMAGQGWGKKRLREEIEKCVILCANCHRKVHNGVLEL